MTAIKTADQELLEELLVRSQVGNELRHGVHTECHMDDEKPLTPCGITLEWFDYQPDSSYPKCEVCYAPDARCPRCGIGRLGV